MFFLSSLNKYNCAIDVMNLDHICLKYSPIVCRLCRCFCNRPVIETTCSYLSIDCFVIQLFLIAITSLIQYRRGTVVGWSALNVPFIVVTYVLLPQCRHHLHSFLCSSSISILCFTFVKSMMYGLSYSIQWQYNRSLLYYNRWVNIKNSFEHNSPRPSDAHIRQ